jgi:hypothetical protein
MAKYKTLHEMFSEHYNAGITPAQCKAILGHLETYELRQSHPMALNTPYIGLDKMYFLPKDQHVLFDTFDIEKKEMLRHMGDCDNVDFNHTVATDPYNLLTVWIVHKIRRSDKLSQKLAEETQVALFLLLHYKFFTSRVNHLFKYGATEGIMIQAVEQLSQKFDIKKPETPTWRAVMRKRSEDMCMPGSIHEHTLNTFGPDDKVFYVISDAQTRIRNKLKLITDAYYEAKEAGESVTYRSITDEIDGKQLIRTVESKYEQMVMGVAKDALSLDQFINGEQVRLVTAMVRNLAPDTFRKFLSIFSGLAIQQYRSGKDMVKEENGDMVMYRGYRALISAIISATYRVVLNSKDINPNSKIDILTKTLNQYRASRISDVGIISTKESVGEWVESSKLSSRSETKGAIRLAFVLYFILQSFKYT